MLTAFLKTALRALLAQKFYAFINVAGLAVGMACFILIILFVQHESSYDRHYAQSDRIYRISQRIAPADGSPDIVLATNAPQVAGLLQQDYPQVENAARIRSWRTTVALGEGQAGYEDTVLADNALLRIFDFVWLAGAADQALAEPSSAVLTTSTAQKYFGDANPLGQTLTLEGRFPVQVTGVIEDLPSTTHLNFDMLVAMPLATEAFGANALESWSSQLYHTYVLLRQDADIRELEQQFGAFIERHIGEGASGSFSFSALALPDIHLHSRGQYELSPPGSSAAVYAFGIIGVIVLLIACINFMNLATARAGQRAREVGIRKTVGARRSQVIVQFLGESVLLAGIAMILALALVELALPVFNALVLKELDFTYFGSGWTLPLLGILTVLVGLLSGSYPAFYLAAFNPAAVLKGGSSTGHLGARFRNALVIVQFSVAVGLLIASATIHRQLAFARGIELGYSKDLVVVLGTSGREGLGRQWDVLKRELLAHPDITAATASNTVPGSQVNASYFIRSEAGGAMRSMPVMLVDYGFFETYQIELAAGRTFAESYGTDQRLTQAQDGPQPSGGTYILNEMAARQLGWTPEEALGKWLEVTCCGFGQGLIVGVTKDVYFEAVQNPMAPVVYLIPPEPSNVVHLETRLGLRQASLRITGRAIEETLAYIDAKWAQIQPEQALSRRFLDEDFAALYQDEQRQGEVLTAFSVLAIFITCLGLYGLSCWNTERRRKEIGVRKVMGGSVWSIVLLLTSDFGRLVLIANVIAWPLAYLAMSRWLETFAYRIDLTPIVFIGSGLIALCVAWVTVGSSAAKAASAKPVLALRYE